MIRAQAPLSEKATLYQYTKLRDLRPGTDIHFYGLVTRYKEPYQTKGTDYCLSLAVIDETLPRISNADVVSGAIPVVIFNRDRSRLPQLRGIGDVIQFRHFRIQPYNDTVQALSMRQSAWIVFSRDERGQWIARPDHRLSDVEMSAIEMIHSGAAAEKKEQPAAGYDSQDPLNRNHQVSELRAGMTGCDVVAEVYKRFSSERCNQTTILLTDYTDNELIRWEEREEIPKHMTRKLLSVFFWDNFATLAGTLNTGDIVKCRNLSLKVVDSKLVATMHGDRSVCPEDNITVIAKDSIEAKTIKRRKENMENLVENSKKFGAIDVTVVKNHCVPALSVMSLLSSNRPCGVACIRGRVVKVMPKSMKNFAKNGSFLFQLIIQDETGQIPIIVYGKEAEKFFSCASEDLGGDQQRGLDILLSSLLPTPFLVKEYTARGRKRFQLFDTFLTV